MSDEIDPASIEFSDGLDNLARYVENLKRNPSNKKEDVEEWSRTMHQCIVSHPYVIKMWSDYPEGKEYVLRETARRIALLKSKGVT